MPPAVFFLRSCHPPILPVVVDTSRPGLQLTTSGWVASHAQPSSVVTTHNKFPEFHIPLKRSPLPINGERRLGPAVRCGVAQRVPGWTTPPTPGASSSHGSPTIVEPGPGGTSPLLSPMILATPEESESDLEEAGIFNKMFAHRASASPRFRSASPGSHNQALVTADWTQPETLRERGEGRVGGPEVVVNDGTGEGEFTWRQTWTGQPMRPGGFIREFTADNNEREFRTPITPPGKRGSTWEDFPRTSDSQECAVASGNPWDGLTSDQRAALQVLKKDYIWCADEGQVFLQAVVGGELDRKLQALQRQRLEQARSDSPTPDYHETWRGHRALSPPASEPSTVQP